MSETKVPRGSLPPGYSFVPKGNVFITSNCRKQTQASGSSVYVVIDGKKQQVGLGVPTEIYAGVRFREMGTRAERAANVLRRDEGLAKGFQKEIKSIFPQIPPDALQRVAKVAMQKGKGKVGRVGKLAAKRKARLAVWAHVRHCQTDYDALLRSGVPREDARRQVEAKAREVCRAWGSGPQPATRARAPKTSGSPAGPSTEASPTTRRAKQGSQGLSTRHPKASSSTATAAKATSPKASKTAGKSTNERNAAVRSARRAHRERQGLKILVKKDGATPAKQQQKTAPKTPSPRVVATAASFREKRTPRPVVV